LKREGIFDEVQARALKRALAEQLEESMQDAKLTKLERPRRWGRAVLSSIASLIRKTYPFSWIR